VKKIPLRDNVRLLKGLDSVFGKLATRILPAPPCTAPAGEIRSILVIRPGGIGDAALLAPAIYRLQRIFPHARIQILAEKRNSDTFALIPGIDQVLLYDTPNGLLQVLRGTYDLVIDTEQWHRLSALVARLTGAPRLIGFDTNERRRMFTHAVPYRHDEYEVSSFLHLLTPLGIREAHDGSTVFLFVPESEKERATTLLHPVGGTPFISIFPGASIAERRWGSRRFNSVVKSLEHHGLRSVIVGGAVDREQGEEIVKDTRALNLAGRTTLAGTAAIISASSLLLSGDSGVLHIAVGLGVPTVSLFGPGIAAKWAPRGTRHTVVNRELPCSPCTRFGTTPPCPCNVSCLSEILPDAVTTAILQQLRIDKKISNKVLDFIGHHC